MADGLLNKASIILTPTGYKAGTLYNVAPVVEPYEDFDFARASVASRVNSSGLVEMVGRTLGSELVQNGDFSELGNNVLSSTWSTGSGWSVITDGVSCDGSVSGGNVNNNVEMTDYNGKAFLLTYTLSNVTDSSTLKYKFGGGALVSIEGTDGTHSVYITNDATVDNFQFVSFTGWSGDITNISLKQVDPNDYWTFSNPGGTHGWRIADGRGICDTSAATKNRNLTSSLSLDGSKDYKLTINILQSADNITIYVGATALSPKLPTGENLGYEYYISSSDHSGGALMFYAGSSDLQEIDNVSVKEIIDTNNIPRISYDSNGDNGHILLEPTSTNLFPYSEDFSQWLIFNTINRTSNYGTSPDGTQNSYEIGSSGGAADFIYLILTITASQSHTLSFFIKNVDSTQSKFWNASESTININWSGSTITSIDSGANYEAYGNGWYKITSTATSNSDGEFIARFYPSTSGTASVELYGYQLESLPYATSYIPTLTGSTETRATETATGAGSADLINSTEGVLYAEIAALAEDGIKKYISLSDGTTSNDVRLYFDTDGYISALSKVGGSTQVFIQSNAYTQTDFNKVAFKYKVNDFALWINGVEVATDNSGNTNTANSLDELNFNGNNLNFYGKCKSLAVFNEALSDDELNNLTG